MRRPSIEFLGGWPKRLGFDLTWLLGALGGACALAAPNELGRPIVRDFPPGRSAISHLCPAVAQDAAGVIYIASGTNIQFYDGATWPVILLPTESAGVRKFAVTANGTVYAGGAGVIGHLRTAGAKRDYVSLAGRLPRTAHGCDDIFDVLAVGNSVYFADEEKILIWRDERFHVVPCPAPPHSRGARLHRVGDIVYVTALDHPLRRLVRDRLEVVADDPVLRQNQIISVEAGRAGALVLLSAAQGFFQLAAGRVTPLPLEANRWLAGKVILRAQRLADHSLAVAFTSVSGDGGMRFDGEGRYVGPIDNSIGLYVKTLRDFFCDREGGLWLGSETGVFRLEWPSALTVFDAINGLGQGAVADVIRHDGVLCAATAEGVFRLLARDDRDGRTARFERILGQPAYALVSHPGGMLALGYADVLVQSASGFSSVASLPPGGGDLYRSKHDPDRVWIGTTHGLQSLHHSPAGWRDEGLVPGFEENCRSLTEATDGTLWFASVDRGVFHLEFIDKANPASGPPRIERFNGGRGLPEKFSRAATTDWAGALVVMVDTASRPHRFDAGSGSFIPVDGLNSLPSGVAGDGWIADEGDFGTDGGRWLASRAGIYRASREGGEPRRLPELAAVASGPITRMRQETVDGKSVLWVCGANGLVRVEVARAFPAPVPFATVLSTTDLREGEHLSHEHRALKFDYLAPRYQIVDAVSYQTRLAGLERDWSAWSPARLRSFTSLPAGRYRFEVRARDADGQMSTPASLAFDILSPWWLTGWALLGYTAAGTGILAGLVRLRTRALRQRARRLEGVVTQRTAELAQKNVELTRLHRLEFDEKTTARLAEEKARLEVLRYQLNPHFLYNTLASISASLPAGRSTARTMVERLADFCRLTLHRPNERDWTTLGEEMQLLRVYLEIEQSRWGDLLDLEIACDAALDGERLPYFLLLPLVENALKHGRATSPDRVGLRLAARRERDDTLVLEVANTGEWLEPVGKRTVSSLGIGLENLRERLTRYYPGSHRLTLSSAAGWVTVTLRLTGNRPAEAASTRQL